MSATIEPVQIIELQGAIMALTPYKTIPPAYTWERHRYELRQHIRRNNPSEFLTWSTVHAVMFVGNAPYIIHEWNELCKDIDSDRWLNAIKDPGFGKPDMLPFAPFTSGNYVHQSYHLMQWERASRCRIENLRKIVEFGAGYGSACAISRALGFTGEYVLYDLPEFSLLQRYYLSNIGVQARYKMIVPPIGSNMASASKGKGKWEWMIDVDPGADLLIACYSLSEVETLVRERFFDALSPDRVLIAHNEEFPKGVDQKELFDKFGQDRPEYTWQAIPNRTLPGHWYRFGDKRREV